MALQAQTEMMLEGHMAVPAESRVFRLAPWVRLLVPGLLLALLVGLLFGGAFCSPLMPDDVELVVMGRAANERGFIAANRFQAEDVVRPLPLLVYAADYRLFGMDASGYRLSMALLHLANALLVFVLAWRFSRSREFSFLAAALFATHFANWENVVWIATLDDHAMLFFLCASLLAYERFCRCGAGRYYLLALVAAVAALLCKESAVTLAPMIFVTDLLLRPDQKPRRRLLTSIRRTAPFFVLCFLLVAAIVANGILGRYISSPSLGLSVRDILRNGTGYLAWMVFPFQTAGSVPGVSDGDWVGQGLVAVFRLARAVAVLGAGWLIWRGSNRQRLLCLWLLLAIAPYTFRTVMFPRYAYPATALFAVLAACLARDWLASRPGALRVVRALVVAFIAVSVFLVQCSPSVAAFKGYARAGEPIVAAVCRNREEMAVATEIWLVDPPPFAAPGERARERMWSQIASLVHDAPIPTRTLFWSEWQSIADRGHIPDGAQVYWWHNGVVERLR